MKALKYNIDKNGVRVYTKETIEFINANKRNDELVHEFIARISVPSVREIATLCDKCSFLLKSKYSKHKRSVGLYDKWLRGRIKLCSSELKEAREIINHDFAYCRAIYKL